VNLLAALEAYPLKTAAGIAYREGGNAHADRTLMFLHGIGSGSGSWVQQLGAFAGWRTLAWDAPGYGKSTPLEAASPDASAYADALLRCLDALKIERVTLVAQSLGAIMAARFATRHRNRMSKLILTAPARGHGTAPSAERASKLAARIEQMKKLGPEGMAATRGGAMLTAHAPSTCGDLLAACQRELTVAGYIQAAHLLSESDIGADASEITQPVLVISGDADTITPLDACRDVAQAFPCGAHRVLPGLAHGAYVEDASTVGAILKLWLDTPEAPALHLKS
jgi:pimeloyl-ACP methyl ester carboxylesterase